MKISLVVISIFILTSCFGNHTKQFSIKNKYDTATFWRIIDSAFNKGKFNNDIKEETILKLLIKLKPDQIVDFEIAFQDIQNSANTYKNLAAATIMCGGASDDGFYYFRCWLIALGKANFYKTQKSIDFLATLKIPKVNYDIYEFEQLLSIADKAFGIVTNKTEDETFPRTVAQAKGLYFDTGGQPKGKEWDYKDLPKIAPKLYKKYTKK